QTCALPILDGGQHAREGEAVGDVAGQGRADDADGSGDGDEGADPGHGEVGDVGEVEDGHGGPQAAADPVDEGDGDHAAAVGAAGNAFGPGDCAAHRMHCSPLREVMY